MNESLDLVEIIQNYGRYREMAAVIEHYLDSKNLLLAFSFYHQVWWVYVEDPLKPEVVYENESYAACLKWALEYQTKKGKGDEPCA